MMREKPYNRSPVNTKLMTMKKAPNPMLPEDFPSLMLFALVSGATVETFYKSGFFWFTPSELYNLYYSQKKIETFAKIKKD